MSYFVNGFGIGVYNQYLPYGRLKVDTPRTTWTITLSEAKAHLRIASAYTFDDTYITTLIKIAQNVVEQETSLILDGGIGMTYVADGFMPVIDLGVPATAITHVKYRNSSDQLITLTEGTDYKISNLGFPNAPVRIYPSNNTSWPSTAEAPDVVTIDFTAGTTANNVPEGLREAILLVIGRYYEMRQDVITGTVVHEMPLGAKHLINQFKNATV